MVREATVDGIVLTTHGRASGFAVDPIEKKPLYHFYPGTQVLSFGTAGCNLGCRFCQNWHLSKARDLDRLQQIASPETIAQMAARSHCPSVAFTYNDPVIFAEYAIDTALACRMLGIKTVAVTAGYIDPAARTEFFAPIDAANVDLKAFSETFYRKFCLAHLAPVLDTLLYLVHETRVWVEITTLVIPGANDSPEELHALARWIATELRADLPLHFSAYRPSHRLHTPATTAPDLLRAREIALAAGLQHVYTGNIPDPTGQSTKCPGCSHMLIERRGYRTKPTAALHGGKCGACGAGLAGHFSH